MPNKRKIKKVMHEFKEGELKSGSGRKVTSKDQAVAIAMHEAGYSKPSSASKRLAHKRKKRGY